MRTILSLILCLPIITHAAEIECWSGDHRIYKGIGSRPYYAETYVGFYEHATHKEVAIFADCIVKMSANEIADNVTD